MLAGPSRSDSGAGHRLTPPTRGPPRATRFTARRPDALMDRNQERPVTGANAGAAAAQPSTGEGMTWDGSYDDILETLGHTPAVKIVKLAPSHLTLYVKIEAFNPSGSVNFHLAPAA